MLEALDYIRSGGRMVLASLPDERLPLDVTKYIVLREISLRGVYGRKLDETWIATERLLRALIKLWPRSSPITCRSSSSIGHSSWRRLERPERSCCHRPTSYFFGDVREEPSREMSDLGEEQESTYTLAASVQGQRFPSLKGRWCVRSTELDSSPMASRWNVLTRIVGFPTSTTLADLL